MNMKRFLKITTFLSVISLLFVACEKDIENPVAFSYENTQVPTLITPADGGQLAFEIVNSEEIATLEWTAATYAANDGEDLGAPIYTVSASLTDAPDTKVAICTSTELSYAMTEKQLNLLLSTGLALTAETETAVTWSISAELPNYSESMVSSTAATTVKVFNPATVELVTAAEFTAPVAGDAFVLTEATMDEVITMAWNAAVYEAADAHELAEVQYTVTVVYGEESATIATVTATEAEITVGDLNTTLMGIGVPAGEETEVTMTLTSEVPEEMGTASEMSIVVKATLYEPTPPANLWVPGGYQGWDPSSAPMLYAVDTVDVFTGYVNFGVEGEVNFKFTGQPNWDGPNYGSDDTEWGLSIDDEAGNLDIVEIGNYFLTVNTTDLIWSKELRTFGLVGSFNEWGTNPDAELTWVPETRMFTVTIDFTAGTEFKWRANSDWAVNLGSSEGNTLVQDGGNIVVNEDGNYTISLKLEGEVASYEMVKN